MENLYLWTDPSNYPEKCIGAYQYNASDEWLMFGRGRPISAEDVNFMPTVIFEVPKEKIQKYDGLPCSGTGFLVNQKIRDLLVSLAPNDVQFFPAKVICTDGELTGYFFLNITCVVDSIDHEASVYTLLDLPFGVKIMNTIKRLVFKKDCMQGHKIARDKEKHSQAFVSQEIFDAFQKEKISGVRLVLPQEYYGEIYPKYQ